MSLIWISMINESNGGRIPSACHFDVLSRTNVIQRKSLCRLFRPLWASSLLKVFDSIHAWVEAERTASAVYLYSIVSCSSYLLLLSYARSLVRNFGCIIMRFFFRTEKKSISHGSVPVQTRKSRSSCSLSYKTQNGHLSSDQVKW